MSETDPFEQHGIDLIDSWTAEVMANTAARLRGEMSPIEVVERNAELWQMIYAEGRRLDAEALVARIDNELEEAWAAEYRRLIGEAVRRGKPLEGADDQRAEELTQFAAHGTKSARLLAVFSDVITEALSALDQREDR